MDMNSCKPGDKLICRDGSVAYYLDRKGTPHFPHHVRYIINPQTDEDEIDTVTDQGFSSYVNDGTDGSDIVSFRFNKNELLALIEEYITFQETGILSDGLLRAHVADKPAYLLAVTVQNAMLDIFLPYAEKYLKEL